ncbi:SGNH/GDSL hydrolase family protein [Aphanizomenon sp. 202]|uniref:SGNH/GDSL hydrolase family protein n=1 Tax=Aphanizomenon flos-aquae TaxID=1176 RepID=UPI0009B8FCDC|nr:SGNH/GDSL hydrolase family protein [Aphanizomenon flos-aquae]MDK2411714.1 SGNH/GDSL hydrolase family protein [Aphanizomenon sp. 202]
MSNRVKTFPIWGLFALLTNIILMLAVVLLIWRQQKLTPVLATTAILDPPEPVNLNWKNQYVAPELGPRHQLSYPQWLDILKQEAKITARKNPQRLTILAGDSLSLWFPPELLPEDRSWLNQGISGEVSNGLLQRLDFFDRTKPEKIFIMVGINDLIRGLDDQEILANYQQIISYLRRKHPQTEIVVQSILPHGGEGITWEGKEKLLAIPNPRIRNLNQELNNLATEKGVKYLNLHPLFTDKQGNLRSDFTTDGLHLSPPGYLVWRTALQMYTNQQITSQATKPKNINSKTRI